MNEKWHTGTPTEDGEYVVVTSSGTYTVLKYKEGSWWLSAEIHIPQDCGDYIKAYQKFEPYTEANT
jgi:hypothetical protein